jgi:transposase-like protein
VPKVPPYPKEFRERAVQLVRANPELKVGDIARELGVSESGLRNWIVQADVDAGERPGLTSDERKELADLRRQNRRLAMENEILKRAAAYFAQENVLPK